MDKINDISFLKDKTLLIIDDEKLLRESLNQALKHFVKKIILAADGKEAVEKYNQNNIDLIISDIHMPRMNGIELLQKIREKNQKIPFYFLTAFTEIQEMEKAQNLGVNGYIVKPLNIKTLIKNILS